MTTNTPITINESEDQKPQPLIDSSLQTKRQIYAEVNFPYMGALKWLGLAFVVMVLFLQYFSGYS